MGARHLNGFGEVLDLHAGHKQSKQITERTAHGRSAPQGFLHTHTGGKQ